MTGRHRRPSWRDDSDTVMWLRWWRARISTYLHVVGRRRDENRRRPPDQRRSPVGAVPERLGLRQLERAANPAHVLGSRTTAWPVVERQDDVPGVLPDGRQAWREDAVERLLDTEDADVLFVAGCEENQVRFHPQFDHIVLLTASLETLLERLATRTNNPYGKDPEELRRFLADVESVEPLLRNVATHVIRTTAPPADVVAEVLAAVGE